MKNSNKVFDGAVNLTFRKAQHLFEVTLTSLIILKAKSITGHKLLFAIANPEDGVVDRHEYREPAADFDLILQNFGTRFKVFVPDPIHQMPVRYYWIDAGYGG